MLSELNLPQLYEGHVFMCSAKTNKDNEELKGRETRFESIKDH